jgi:SAM-dependent MidA family methyltransferase
MSIRSSYRLSGFGIMGGVASSGELLSILRNEIRDQGPITFARFMELALYHPDFGYYRTRDRFGRAGDFYTAEQLQPVFGEVMARFVDKLTQETTCEGTFGVLELGAGRAEMKQALARWNYRPYDWASAALPESWTGLIFANEFFDALPVRLLTKRASGWMERLVTCRGDELCFTLRSLEEHALLAYAAEFGGILAEGGELEAAVSVPAWLTKIASILNRGRLLVIDYGYDARELVRFPAGTLLSYRRHQASADLLREPGARDITAHVNFTWLLRCAEQAGFVLERSTSLARWVLSIWGEEEFARRWESADQRWKLQWKQLVFGMGETFRVMELRLARRQA